jgi:hypothetical protein
MDAQPQETTPVPHARSLARLERLAANCTACDLYERATL